MASMFCRNFWRGGPSPILSASAIRWFFSLRTTDANRRVVRDPYPSKILQMPNLVVILFEGNLHSFRQIFLDRKEHPKDLDPTWWGDSIGHWEGDQLVVDTVGFNGKTWLDLAGHPASDQLHVIERYSRPDLGHLKWEITIEDPVMYTRPWKVTEITPLLAKGDLIEYVCTENERDSRHLDAIDALQKATEKEK